MKKEYIFLILVTLMLYLLYLIVNHKYKEYIVNSHIEKLEKNNKNIEIDISNNKEKLTYLYTNAYKNKVLKETQGLKNKGEYVIHITNEKNYNKYTNITSKESIKENDIYKSNSIFEKWIIFLINDKSI